MKQIIHIVALIRRQDKVLLHRISDTSLGLPQVVLDGGELPVEALARAIAPAGLQPENFQAYDVISFMDSASQHVVVVFLVAPSHENNSEHHEVYEWKELSKLQRNDVTKLTKTVLKLEQPARVSEKEQSSIGTIDVTRSTKAHQLVVHSDGGSRGNPGPSAAGFVVWDNQGNILFEGGKYLGVTTNNQAEYQAVRLGLEKAYELGAKTVDFKMDSLLIVNQMTGVYQIKNRDLWPIYTAIQALIKKFDHVHFAHVRREFNQEADAMVNKILDQHKNGGI